MSTQLRGGSIDKSGEEENILKQHLFYMNEHMKNYSLIDTGASIPIIAWELTKNCSYINSDILVPSHSPNFGNSHRFKLDADSSNMSEKDIELLYRLIGRLLFTSKITTSDVQACVTYPTYSQG